MTMILIMMLLIASSIFITVQVCCRLCNYHATNPSFNWWILLLSIGGTLIIAATAYYFALYG